MTPDRLTLADPDWTAADGPLTLGARAESYARHFPECPGSVWVAGDRGQWLYGVWQIGAYYKNASRYYGAFPHSFLPRVLALFPEVDPVDILHAFSGSLEAGPYTRLDINPDCGAELVGSVYDVAALTSTRFRLVIADPSYSAADAVKYGTASINRGRATRALAEVVAPGGHLAWLDTAWPMPLERALDVLRPNSTRAIDESSIPRPVAVRTKGGRVRPYYNADGIVIYHGDALSVIAELASESVGVVFTDPPYSSGARNSARIRGRGSMRRGDGAFGSDEWIGGDNLSAHGFAMMVRLFGVETFRVVIRDGHLFSFMDWRQLPVLQGAIEAAGWSARALLVWDKIHFGLGNGFRQQAEFVLHASKGIGDNFVRHDVGTVMRALRQSDDIGHPTVKPIGAVQQWLSAVPGDVLDPFMGSGTTLLAAKGLGRRAIGIELEEKYCEIAATRLAQGSLPLQIA